MRTNFSRFKKTTVAGLLALSLACGSLFAFQDSSNTASAQSLPVATAVHPQLQAQAVTKVANRSHHKRHYSVGTVSSATATSLIISTAKGKSVTFVVTDKTKFVNATSPVATNTKVRVLYSVKDGKLTALKVVAKKSK